VSGISFSETVSEHLNTRVTNRLCHGSGALRALVINSHLLNGRYPPIFVSDVTKPFLGFSGLSRDYSQLHRAFSHDNRYPMPMGRNIVVISKMAGVLKERMGTDENANASV
jgi:hypothetical protein